MAHTDSPRMRIWTLLGVAFSMGCGTAVSPPTHTPNSAASSAASASSTRVADETWLSKLDRDNALVGKIWDVRAGAFVTADALMARVAGARFVLLGEHHDNADHHRLQARVLAQLVAAGRHPAVVFEMLETLQQPQIDEYVVRPAATALGFGTALGWDKTGWPPFAQYQPIFETAFAAKLAIWGGNVAHADVKALVKQGLPALPAERVKELRLGEAFPAPLEAALLDELRASHCGQLPETLLGPMALAQHARDAQMAKVLVTAGARDGAVLIAGGGHARLDRAVPYYLALEVPGAAVVSIAFREVRHADADPGAYVNEEGPFDYVWFTPRGTDDDPCVGFHAPAK